MAHNKILLVEDEKNISNVIKAYLLKEEYEVITAFDGEEAIDLFNKENPDLIILDLMIPKIPGEKVCTKIREDSDVPIIILTAKSDEENKIQGLSLGADDYVVKPFSSRELVSRVKALMRRVYHTSRPIGEKLVFPGNLEIYPKQMIGKKNNTNLNLTANEFKVLMVMASHPGIVFTRKQLLDKVFGFDYEGYDRTIDTYIKNIRQKIEDNPKSPQYILTVYGMGYKFETQK